MACRISKLVHSSIRSLDDGCSVQEAAAFMAANNLGSIVVTNNGEVAGLFTERDLIRRVVGPGKAPDAVTLGEVCSRKLISVHEDVSCENAIKTMNNHRCRRLLVYRGDTLKGMVTMPAIADAMADRKAKANALVNVVGGVTVLVTLLVIGFGLYQLPQMARIAMAVIK